MRSKGTGINLYALNLKIRKSFNSVSFLRKEYLTQLNNITSVNWQLT